MKRIVAIDGMPIFPLLAGADADARKATAARIAASLADMDHDALVAYDRKYLSTIGTIDPALAAPAGELLARSDPRAEAAWLSEDLTTDLQPALPSITVPFTKTMPYADAPAAAGAPAYTLEQTRAFYASLPAGAKNAQVVPIEHARHYAMLDAPEAFYAALDGFVKSLP